MIKLLKLNSDLEVENFFLFLQRYHIQYSSTKTIPIKAIFKKQGTISPSSKKEHTQVTLALFYAFKQTKFFSIIILIHTTLTSCDEH